MELFLQKSSIALSEILKKPTFEKGDGNWIDVLPTKTKQYKNRIHSSTKITLIQASLIKNEGNFYQHFLSKGKK